MSEIMKYLSESQLHAELVSFAPGCQLCSRHQARPTLMVPEGNRNGSKLWSSGMHTVKGYRHAYEAYTALIS